MNWNDNVWKKFPCDSRPTTGNGYRHAQNGMFVTYSPFVIYRLLYNDKALGRAFRRTISCITVGSSIPLIVSCRTM